MKWSDIWSVRAPSGRLSTERDTGFEPATSSLGSWVAHHAALKNRLLGKGRGVETAHKGTACDLPLVRGVVSDPLTEFTLFPAVTFGGGR